jgi:hypothetical protein
MYFYIFVAVSKNRCFMSFKKINNITGWIVFAIATAVYFMTMEATVSFWDCGEFLSTAYKLEVGHSPGAPLFMMLGRLFALFASSKETVAICINAMSAVMSSLTILFLFWTITHFAKKLLVKHNDEEPEQGNMIAIMGAGIIGALAYTFSDTFWFSAVEGEVYATSSFFTAIVFWAILKWEHAADHPHADRWLILIFYLMGLSIGVHLLNLLTIPAIIMVYYFKRYVPTLKGGIIAFIVGCAVLGLLQFGVIQWIPILASGFELMFVNSLHLPFNSGAIFFLVLMAIIFVVVLRIAKKRNWYIVHLATLCLVFTVIGYSSYIATVIRSKADVAIDMVNPDNVMSLVPYLQREQYGQQPLLSGPRYDTGLHEDPNDKGTAVYLPTQKDGKDYYEQVGTKRKIVYDATYPFPRLWDRSKADEYRSWLGLSENEEPSGIDNIRFFVGYQVKWMWWRYFMWNYVGRQNDVQGQGEARNANWISGIKPIDKLFGVGDIDKLDDAYAHNKARNQLYFLPFILGIIGLVYQFKRGKLDGIIVAILFFFTGLAIVIYLNNTPNQPRERDYAYVSTYAFAVWIGLGVLMVTDWFRKFMKGNMPAIAATLLCLLAVPVLMAAEEWDDHDRSKKTLARDHALNMLNTCDSNAILITYGDNDTYPLWYLQEIEGIRTDVRIVNYNLLGTDWQNEQIMYKINDADAIPVIWTPDQFKGDGMEYIPFIADPRLPANSYFELEEVIKFFTNPANKKLIPNWGRTTAYLPTRNLSQRLDKDALIKNGLVSAADTAYIPDQMKLSLKSSGASRADLSLMNIIAGVAKDGWRRPIYFTDGTPNIGLDAYFQSEGVLNKVVPVVRPNNALSGGGPPFTDLDKNLNMFMKTYTWGGANGNNIYYDEKNRLTFIAYKSNAADLSIALSMNGRKDDAKKLLDHMVKSISESSSPLIVMPYDRSALFLVEAYYRADDRAMAKKIGDRIALGITKNTNYFFDLNEGAKNGMMGHLQIELSSLNLLVNIARGNGDEENASVWLAQLNDLAMKAGFGQQQQQRPAQQAPQQLPALPK